MLEGDPKESMRDSDLKEEIVNDKGKSPDKKRNKICLIVSLVSCAVAIGAVIAIIVILLKDD
jgi:hypothetical protein